MYRSSSSNHLPQYLPTLPTNIKYFYILLNSVGSVGSSYETVRYARMATILVTKPEEYKRSIAIPGFVSP